MTPDEARDLILALVPAGGVRPGIDPHLYNDLCRELYQHLIDDNGFIPGWLRSVVTASQNHGA